MGTNEHDRRRSSEGPQVFGFENAPEVVSGPDWESKSKVNRSSLYSPQAWNTDLPEATQGRSSDKTAVYSTEYSDKEANTLLTAKPEQRKYCGLRRKTFLWLSVGVFLLVVIAAVLGGVLGTVLDKSDDDERTDDADTSAVDGPSLLVRDKTGLAMVNPSGSQTLYAYYMDAAGKILEGTYENGTWDQRHLADQQAEITKNVTSAPPGTSIAAVAYTRNSEAYRQIFWLDSQGLVTTSNRTDDGAWSEPYSVTGDRIVEALPSARGLAACAGNSSDGLNGIRLYYGSTDGYVQEIGLDFNSTNVWTRLNGFAGSDAQSGVACTMTGNVGHVYFRNTTNSALQQWTKDYASNSVQNSTTFGWQDGTASRSGNVFATGGSVAATSDGQDTDYVFYHSAENETSYTFVVGQTMTEPSSDIEWLQYSPVGYYLAATWAPDSDGNEGAVSLDIYYDHSDLYFGSVSRDGQAYEAVTETGR
ncbi:hypothetical protein HII31_12857 [Pseudocercospora fuligena]|uniref:Fucose-specific lectin n=1 Tax=Pseudocercospora fuligena TaxID=685502 RepID=A0A8H6VC26_9PEZI|nr:hypothetical protein HII31_12857 [Pseudocercospora fuligena]